MSSLKEKTVKGVAWSAIDRFSAQGIQFVFNILIARILLPEDYGLIAMLNIFLDVSRAFIDSGFANALIRKTDRTEVDYCTVFYFNLTISLFFYALLWFAAPVIARFYDIPLLSKVTRIVSLSLVIGALGSIQSTRLVIKVDFKTRSVIHILSTVVIGGIGLWLAVKGYGVWALVAQSVVGNLFRTFLYWIIVKWRPRLIFSWKSLKEMFSFGSKLLLTGLTDTVYGNLYSILIGKIFEPASLGKYNRAESFASFPSSNLFGIVNSVSYPILCSVQQDRVMLKDAFRKIINVCSFVVFPAMIGLAAVSEPFVKLILTEKWIEIVPLLRILCVSFVFYPLSAYNITFPNVVGKSGTYFKLSIINKCVDVPILIAMVPLGLKWICFGKVVSTLINLFINTVQTKRIISWGFFSQIKDIAHIIAHSAIMGIVVTLVMSLFDSDVLKLTMGILSGSLYYCVAAIVFRFKEFVYLKDYIDSRRQK